MNQPAQPWNILVVDDTIANLHLLNYVLKKAGYKVRPVTSGAEALCAAASNPPDLILLDINMPEMDGLEVCRRLRENPQLKDIPILFISALSEVSDRVKAFHAGGVDYIPKPFQIEEVEARVATHLELAEKRKNLEANFAKLKELETLRDTLVHMVVHDMRAPLSIITLSLELLREDLPELSGEPLDLLETAKENALSLREMASSILDLSKMEAGRLALNKKDFDLAALLREDLKSLRTLTRKVDILLEAPDVLPCNSDPALLSRVLANLVCNAIKFSKDGEKITVTCTATQGLARLQVIDHGPGINPEHLGNLFQKFSQVLGEKQHLGFGLGLAFCKMAIEALGGRLGVESRLGEGSTFWLELPLPPLP